MTYKETLFFIGKCLTITHENHNKILVEDDIKSGNIDWDAVVKVSTGHFVFPALYCNLRRANFLHYLPQDLVLYMKHITDLNRERNQEIIEQAKEINELLLVNNITPIFLKGTGNLLEGLYEDIGERMVGDIDILVSNHDFQKAIAILKKDGYATDKLKYMTFHWHYPRIVKEKKICALEVHNKVLKKPYTKFLSYDTLIIKYLEIGNYKIASYNNQLLINILPKQINDNLYFSKTISLRTIYDYYLLSEKNEAIIDRKITKKIDKQINNFLSCASLVLNQPNTIKYTSNKSSDNYLKSYHLLLENSKREKRIVDLLNYYVKIKDRFEVIKYSFLDKEYRSFTLRKIGELDFYKKRLGIKPNS